MRSKTINEEMKVAAAKAIAELAREDVPDEVVAAMGGERPHYGKEYIIPSTFDPRLISVIPAAVAKAAMDTGVVSVKLILLKSDNSDLLIFFDPSLRLIILENSF